MIGKTLAHYEISELLGKGGMGEVYRASDAKLGRDVAIKLLPREMSGDPERAARFEREARTLATLQHANIASIYGFEEAEGARFLVMELVEGEDLSQRLERGALDVGAAIEVARQMATALEAAHARGIVHRDLKPANVKLMPDGQVKVLDFGLARAYAGDEADAADPYDSPTITAAMTQAGVVMGTAAYMSPEQARGGGVDARADVWAFGVVLLECLTGVRTFEGGSVSDVLAAVLRDEFDWSGLPSGTPPSLRRLLKRCLERDPARRLHSIADARLELEDAAVEIGEGAGDTAAARPVSRQGGVSVWLPWILSAAFAAVLLVFVLRPAERGSAPAVSRLGFTVKELETSAPRSPVVSPDGQHIIYYADGQLWIRDMDDLTPRAIPGTEGANGPFWSPDSAQLGYEKDGRLWRMPIEGGSAVAIGVVEDGFRGSAGAIWTLENRIIFATGDAGIFEIPASGGNATTLVEVDLERDVDLHVPSRLPQGKGFLFNPHELAGVVETIDLYRDGVRSVAWEPPDGMAVSRPVYSQEHLLFHRWRPTLGIWAVPFSLDEGKVHGEPFLVEDSAGPPSASETGSIVFTRGSTDEFRVVSVDLEGTIEATAIEPATHIDDLGLSPDGTRLVSLVEHGSKREVVVEDLTRGTRTTLTADESLVNPFWISNSSLGVVRPDSMRILMYDLASGMDPTVLFDARGRANFSRGSSTPLLTHDGKHIVFFMRSNTTKADIWFVPSDGSGEARALLATEANEDVPRPSPVSGLLAYSSDSSGREEIYLTVFDAEKGNASGRWQLSSDGGSFPRWNADGSRIYYNSRGKLMEVVVEWDGALTLGRPRELFELSFQRLELNHGYLFDPRSSKFLMIQVGDPGDKATEIVVMQNWVEAFRGQ